MDGSDHPDVKAQLKVVDPKTKEGADVIFFHFGPSNGGGTRANVDRWLGQFQESHDKINAKVDETTIGKTKVTYVQAEGTYNSGMPGGPKTPMPNYALLGAIIEGAEGSVFARLTGPSTVAANAKADFRTMIESALK